MGLNGAGKSTLLKIITETIYPTEGSFTVRGRLLSLLELGTGFKPNLTGRENLYASSRLLGFPKDYLDEQMDNIERFADIGEYFDRPYRFFSSGMRARLGFALFSFLKCDLLLIDEVFAVGDVFFRQKCYARLEELLSEKAAVVFVSHSLPAIQQYCQEAIILHKGRIVFYGPADEAVKRYTLIDQPLSRNAPHEKMLQLIESQPTNPQNEPHPHDSTDPAPLKWPDDKAFHSLIDAQTIGDSSVQPTRMAMCDTAGNPTSYFCVGQTAHFYYEFLVRGYVEVPISGIVLKNDRNITVHAKHTYHINRDTIPKKPPRGALIRVHQSIKLDIAPSAYTVSIDFCSITEQTFKSFDTISQAEFKEQTFAAHTVHNAGAVNVLLRSRAMQAIGFMGLCDLEGQAEMSVLPPPPDTAHESNPREASAAV